MDVELWMASNCLPRAWSRRSAEAGRVFPLPHSFQSSSTVTLADWQAPRPSPSAIYSRGQGGRMRRTTCHLLVPKRWFSFSPEFALATSQCGPRAARLESVMPMSTMDDGLLPPRDELSTSCAIYCLESELYFTVDFMILCNWRYR